MVMVVDVPGGILTGLKLLVALNPKVMAYTLKVALADRQPAVPPAKVIAEQLTVFV
jgi:hypothetical protein